MKSLCSPPTINVNVPASAPPTPPDTGASKAPIPIFFDIMATSRELSTSTVEQSSNIDLSFMPFIASAATFLSISPLGSMVMTISALLTHFAILSHFTTASGISPEISYPDTE